MPPGVRSVPDGGAADPASPAAPAGPATPVSPTNSVSETGAPTPSGPAGSGAAGPPAVWVGVIGPGSRDHGADRVLSAKAEEVGRAVARAGAVLVCGGLGGVMAAACRGAAEVGGRTVGLLPGSERAEANPWVEIAIPTGLGELRNGLLVRAADVLVALGGGYGTLSEIGLALRAGRPVVGLGTWRLGPPEGSGATAEVVEADDPALAVDLALSLALAGRR